jgi:FtsH-binding integral membrane protein
MALQDRDYIRSGASTAAAEYDAGLRAHMLRVYNYMCAGLVLTGVVAFAFSQYLMTSPETVQMIYGTPLRWVLALAPFAFILAMSFGINRMSFGTLQIVFWAFAATMGLSLASVLLVYTGMSVAKVFFMTAGMFAATSVYGYTTKRDLSKFGSFLFMGMIGLFIAMIVNIFLQSPVMHYVISAVGILIFTGLTAWDTQRIKEEYHVNHGYELAGKLAVMGAVGLYINFVNIFMFLLTFFGDRE